MRYSSEAPYIVHGELDNRTFLISLLIKGRKSIATVSKMTGAPYNSVLHFAKKHLTEDELKQVPRQRRKFTKEEKARIVLEVTQGRSIEAVAAEHQINRRQLSNWRYEILGTTTRRKKGRK